VLAVCLLLAGIGTIFATPELEDLNNSRCEFMPVRTSLRITLQDRANKFRSGIVERKNGAQALAQSRSGLRPLREYEFISIASRERQLAALVIDGDGRSPPARLL
jgi:hypothetical protein